MLSTRGVVVVGLLVLCATARADNRELAREHYQKGTKAFELALYDDAIKEYMAAYQIRDEAALLYNIAQAHRLANHPTEALRFYRIYLIKMPRAENRPEVEVKIDELQKFVEQQKRTQNLPPDSPIKPGAKPVATATPSPSGAPPPSAASEPSRPAAATPPSPAPAAPEPTAAAAVTSPAPPAHDANAGRTKTIAGIAVGVVGVALVATGIAFLALAQQAGNDLTTLDRNMGVFDPSKESAGKLDVALGGAFIGVGVAAVGVGAAVLLLGRREAAAARRHASIVPVLSPQAVGATVRIAF